MFPNDRRARRKKGFKKGRTGITGARRDSGRGVSRSTLSSEDRQQAMSFAKRHLDENKEVYEGLASE